MEIVNAPAEPSISVADSQPTLHDLERIIEEGEARRKASYRETGKALYAIKSRRLFNGRHRTWQDYVTKRRGFSRQRAHQLMQAWVEAEMSTALDNAKTEREARRRRQGKSTRSFPTANVAVAKVLSREDFMLFLERIAKLVDEQFAALNDRFDAEVPA